MDSFLSALRVIMDGFDIPMTIYGFTFSFWDIMIFSVVVSILAYFIGRLIYG